jgi:hypothetical protein
MRVAALALAAVVVLGCGDPQLRRVRTLMQDPVAPASDALFNAVIYTNGQLAASPQTDAAWARLAQHTAALVSAATTLKTLAPAEMPDEWLRQAEVMRAASATAQRAVDDRSLQGILDAGSQLYASCTACHAAYVKDN